MTIEEFKTRKENYDPKKWEVAIKLLKTSDFPDDEMTQAVMSKKIEPKSGESHETQKNNHSLQTYEYTRELNGFEIDWKYNFCPYCNKVIVKVGTLVNDIENVVYRKFYVKDGEEVKTPARYNSDFAGALNFSKGGDSR